MQRKTLLPALLFVGLALGIFFAGKTPLGGTMQGFLQSLFLPVTHLFINQKPNQDQEKFLVMIDKQVNLFELEQENKALRDQFQTVSPASIKLLPARIVGAPKFLPGISLPEYFVIDKGKSDGVKTGQAVIYKNMIVGKITTVSEHLSKILLVTSPSSSFTVKAVSLGKESEEVLGVARGIENGEIIMEKVVLSDTLTIGDLVVTKGDIDEKGIGYPANMVVGKIVSIDKKPSALFQSARVRNLIDFSKLTVVFLFNGYE